MARFYTSNVNSRGTLSGRIAKAGSDVHTRGWNAGVKVVPIGIAAARHHDHAAARHPRPIRTGTS